MIWYGFISLMIFYLTLSFNFFFIAIYFIFTNKIFLLKSILYSWTYLNFEIIIFLDPISLIFTSVVSFISSMVVFFSIYYMKSDQNKKTFIQLLNLFVISMMFMILCPNAITILIGWDGLGLSSYLLVIYYKSSYSNYAGTITILTNRLGDIGLIICILFFSSFPSMIYPLNNQLSHFSYLMIFILTISCLTKSAQFPFSAWLPAAMAAPTPISALVHSSTLVTAGIYILIRFHYFFNSNSTFSFLIFLTALITMTFSGLNGLWEMDMKKVIALSTLSQLSVMLFSLSLGMKSIAFFHLITHALFKALLFLCIGITIHMNSNNQNMKFSGLSIFLDPLVSNILSLATLSLCGFFFLSGFYSKDLILELFYSSNNKIFISIITMMAMILTSSYSIRLIYLTNWKNFITSKILFFKESFYFPSHLPLISMSYSVIFFGSFFNWMFFNTPPLSLIPNLYKILNMSYLPVAIFLFFIYYFLKFPLNSFFFNSMMFIPNIQGFISNTILKTSFYHPLMFNSGWIFSTEMIFSKNLSKIYQKFLFSFNFSKKFFFYIITYFLVFLILILIN